MVDAQTIAAQQSALPENVQKAIDAAFQELREKAWSNEEKLAKAAPAPNDNQPKSWFADPFALLDSVGMGYRNAPTYLTYDTLRQVAERDTYVAPIILTRQNQAAAFTQPQRNKYSVGFVIQPRYGDKKRELTRGEQDRVRFLTAFMTNTGRDENVARDDLDTFTRKFVRDSLTYDQACHPAGTMVHLADGSVVPIEQLKVGMRVWTHLGRVRRVEKVMRRSYTGEMYRVTSGGQSVVCTEGHPLFAEANRWLNIAHYKERGFEPEWLGPEDLKAGAYLTSPWLTPEAEEVVDVPSWGPLDATLATLLGLYVAEGHEQGGALTLTFHSDEEDLVEFVEAQAKYAGHDTARVEYKDRNAIGVRIKRGDDGQLAAWFVESCGRGSNNKRVPPFILRAPREIRLGFLFGYLLGDGTSRPGGASFTTTSQALFHGVRALLAMEHVYARQNIRDFSAYGWAQQYQANLSGSRWRAVAKELDFPQTTLPTREPHVVDEAYAYLKISKVERWSVADEPVFNCEVEEDHSYIANGFSSHNCFEKVRTRAGRPFSFHMVPSDTIRTATPKQMKGTPGRISDVKKDIKYVQLINSTITAEFTQDEMCFAVRNPRTHVKTYGYGFPEIETLITTITSHLWAEEWNRRAFSQGSTVKGLLNVKGHIQPLQFEAFKRMWHSQVAGVQNAWRTPMLNSEEVQWIPMQLSNTEMGYQMWMEYLCKITTALFGIDPAEINFDLRGGVGQQPVFMSTNEAQQKASKDRGLSPLLRTISTALNRHVVWQVDPEFELAFVGIDAKTEEQAMQLRQQQAQTHLKLNEVRALDGLPPVEYGDVVMNPTYIGYRMQMMQMAQMSQQQQQAGQQPGGQQPGQQGQPAPRFAQPAGAEEEHGAEQVRQFAEDKPGRAGSDQGAAPGADDESSGPSPRVLSRLHQDDWDSVISHSLKSEDLAKGEVYDVIDLN